MVSGKPLVESGGGGEGFDGEIGGGHYAPVDENRQYNRRGKVECIYGIETG